MHHDAGSHRFPYMDLGERLNKYLFLNDAKLHTYQWSLETKLKSI